MGTPYGDTPTWTRAERQVIISLAGRIAERRALQPDGQGWRRMLSHKQLESFHEAGHAAVAHALGWHCYEINLDPDPELTTASGAPILAYASTGPKPERSNSKKSEILQSDERTAALFCLTMAGNWKHALRHLHVLRATAKDLVERNWNGVRSLASELELRRRIYQDRIASILNRA